MKKKILAASLCLVIVSACFAACGKDKSYEKDDTTATTIEYSTEPDSGELYVTNVSGEHIPVTTNKNGYVELYEDLITKTAEQVSKEAESIKAETDQASDENTTTTTSAATKPTTSGETTTLGKVSIGTADETGKDAVIDFR